MTATLDDVLTTTAPDAGTWRDSGLCNQTDPELFFPEKGSTARPAKQICHSCPVLTDCLTWVLNNPQDYGVWAALTPKDRRSRQGRGRVDLEAVATAA